MMWYRDVSNKTLFFCLIPWSERPPTRFPTPTTPLKEQNCPINKEQLGQITRYLDIWMDFIVLWMSKYVSGIKEKKLTGINFRLAKSWKFSPILVFNCKIPQICASFNSDTLVIIIAVYTQRPSFRSTIFFTFTSSKSFQTCCR